jgi:hypothetical protein
MRWLVATPYPLVICMGLYACMGVGFWRLGQHGLGWTHFAYALANVGLVWAWYEVQS